MNKEVKNMKATGFDQLTFENLFTTSITHRDVILNKEKFIQVLDEINNLNDLSLLKDKIITVKKFIKDPRSDREGLLNIDQNGDTVTLRKDILISELNQILES
jgi:hypothetical protein